MAICDVRASFDDAWPRGRAGFNPTARALSAGISDVPVVIVDITGHCNLKCVHCWNEAYLPFHLETPRIEKVIRSAPEGARIHLLGGEPLLHPDLPELVALSVSQGHYTSLVTNGTLLSAERLAALGDAGLAELAVSLDGPDAETNDAVRGRGTFDRAWAALGLASEYAASECLELTISLSVTASRLNADRLPELVQKVGEAALHIDNVIIDRVVPEGRAERASSGEEGLSLVPSQWLNAAEAICSLWPTYPRLGSLTMKAPPLVHEYLSRHYGVFLRDSIIGCPALQVRAGARICADGSVYSCSREGLIRRAQARGHLPLQGRDVEDLLGLGLDPFTIAEFRRVLAPLLGPPRDEKCIECRWRSDCIECPIVKLISADGTLGNLAHGSSELCDEVLRRWEGARTGVVPVEPGYPVDSPGTALGEGPVRLSPSAYYKVDKEGTVRVLCVPLDKVITFPSEFRANVLLDALRLHNTWEAALDAHGRATGVLRDMGLLVLLKLVHERIATCTVDQEAIEVGCGDLGAGKA